jgi:Na+/H+-translocating membrane pyrophosphatase
MTFGGGPSPPPIPFIIPPHDQEAVVEYHRGAKYDVSLVVVLSLLAFLVFLALIAAMTTNNVSWLFGIIGSASAGLIGWLFLVRRKASRSQRSP